MRQWIFLAMTFPAAAAVQGSLYRVDHRRLVEACPLKHTAVKAEISGFLARVRLTQEFRNESADTIEAVYVFPLPAQAAVDEMTIQTGSRTIRAEIKRRAEARRIYDEARRRGWLAGLLDQERPNIFTQSVANIEPGARVQVTIGYIETLKYEEGSYEFSFPMVVGPRYVPQGTDGSRITPPVAPKGTRAGHDLSLEVSLDAGAPIVSLATPSHETVVERAGARRAVVKLKNRAVIPNKDFILRFGVAGKHIQDVALAHRTGEGGYFALALHPPERVTVEDVSPKELIFVLDTSGSMSGFPIEKAKETMNLALAGLYPRDTFNLITFSGDTHILFPRPAPATAENVRAAREFLASRRGSGGTEMVKAIRAALDGSGEAGRVRVVCFMTDGYVGNDLEILAEVRRHPEARVFAFGIGSSVNRFLLDGMAREGRGEVEYVSLQDDGSAAARRFHERVRNPLLTDITLDFGGLPVSDVYPARVPDLFSAKPVVVVGRYGGAAKGRVRLSGRMSGRYTVREIAADLPAAAPQNAELAPLWARRRIEVLSSQDYAGMQHRKMRRELEEEITQLGLTYRLMTPFTSFVAVEERTTAQGGLPRRVEVPVEMPEGVSHEGVFGGGLAAMRSLASPLRFTRLADAAPPRSAAPEHEAIRRLVERVRHGAALTADDRRFVRDGWVYVEVWLRDPSSEVLDHMRQLGFERTRRQGVAKVVVGRIPLAKLEALLKLPGVETVAPHCL